MPLILHGFVIFKLYIYIHTHTHTHIYIYIYITNRNQFFYKKINFFVKNTEKIKNKKKTQQLSLYPN